MLGHTNLTYTERYTLHTDKHLKNAIDLIDKELDDGQSVTSEGKKYQEQLQLQQIVTLRVIEKRTWTDYDNVLRSDYFSHFIARNEGQNPVIEIELSLFDVENKLLEIHKESVLGVKEEFVFKPMVTLHEGSYNIICHYKSIYDLPHFR